MIQRRAVQLRKEGNLSKVKLWHLGLEHSSLDSHSRAHFNTYSVSTRIPAPALDGGIYHTTPLQLPWVLTLLLGKTVALKGTLPFPEFVIWVTDLDGF